MNQTRPKTVEVFLDKVKSKFVNDGWVSMDDGDLYEWGDLYIFLKKEIATLLESLKREDRDETLINDFRDGYNNGFNARNRELSEDINKILGK